ncbi:endonuclease/exonuclease/phosphatase family protein [Micromonospora sp. NPDC048871]|uniref:endonuclease/exonuclease/phosphatase family protein n=1 Tax=unclassified Micromonospora TaxID=2617518 RepID=UPI002E0F7446|nr:endonuclease/exonuclease/phosphatase family protein [Micromonospora sp. NBC_01739]
MARLSGQIRIGSWNVREGLPYPSEDPATRPQALDELVGLIREKSIDVLALQEVDFSFDGESAVLAAILGRTELQYAATLPLSDSSFEAGRQAGVAVVSRYPMAGIESFLLPNPGLWTERGARRLSLHDKGAVVCSIDFGLTELKVASLHSFPFHRFGRDARDPAFADVWNTISSKLPRWPGSQLIICGDFNTEERALLLDAFSSSMVRAFDGRPTHFGKEIDDIVFSASLGVAASPRLVSNFSDHDLCLVDLHSRW